VQVTGLLLLVMILGIAVIWIPWKRKESQMRSRGEILKEMMDTVGPARTLRCQQLLSLLDEADNLLEIIVKSRQVNNEYVFRYLETVFPPRIKSYLGDEAHDGFVSLVATSKSNAPDNSVIACLTSLP
jgi:hypothetical protein